MTSRYLFQRELAKSYAHLRKGQRQRLAGFRRQRARSRAKAERMAAALGAKHEEPGRLWLRRKAVLEEIESLADDPARQAEALFQIIFEIL